MPSLQGSVKFKVGFLLTFCRVSQELCQESFSLVLNYRDMFHLRGFIGILVLANCGTEF